MNEEIEKMLGAFLLLTLAVRNMCDQLEIDVDDSKVNIGVSGSTITISMGDLLSKSENLLKENGYIK